MRETLSLEKPPPPMGTRDCRVCRFFTSGGEARAPDYESWGPECDKHPEYEALKSFPFRNTKCRDFNPRVVLTLAPKGEDE